MFLYVRPLLKRSYRLNCPSIVNDSVIFSGYCKRPLGLRAMATAVQAQQPPWNAPTSAATADLPPLKV